MRVSKQQCSTSNCEVRLSFTIPRSGLVHLQAVIQIRMTATATAHLAVWSCWQRGRWHWLIAVSDHPVDLCQGLLAILSPEKERLAKYHTSLEAQHIRTGLSTPNLLIHEASRK
jgi:hypothetical protein